MRLYVPALVFLLVCLVTCEAFSLGGHGKRRSKADVIRVFRQAIANRFMGQDLSIETALSAYRGPDESKGCLVLRPVGPSGTGKTSFACFLAHAMFDAERPLDPESCLTGPDDMDLGEFVISKTFTKDGASDDGESESKVLDLFREANEKLSKHPEGILIILNDYNLAGPAVWAFMRAFLKQANMKTSVVVLTDDLTRKATAEYTKEVELHLSTSDSEADALEKIVDHIKLKFPEAYRVMSPSDTWIPFLPFPDRVVEMMVEKVCQDIDKVLRLDLITGQEYLGRLICDIKSRKQAAIKLNACVALRGARALHFFKRGFEETLRSKEFCANGDDWTDCLKDSDGLATRSILLQVDPLVEEPGENPDCSPTTMAKWMSFGLFDASPACMN